MSQTPRTKEYEVVYFELTRLSRLVDATSVEDAISQSEVFRARGAWGDCTEESEGTNGVERVYLHKKKGDSTGKEVYNSGTTAGLAEPDADPNEWTPLGNKR